MAPARLKKPIEAEIPPHSMEAEQSVLGGIIRDNNVLVAVLEKLHAPEEFYTDAHQKIFAAMLRLHKDNAPIDLVTLAEELHKNKHVEDLGGYGYLAKIYDACPAAANAAFHASIVADHAIRRRLLHAGNAILRNAQNPTGPSVELIAKAQQSLEAAANGTLGKARFRFSEELPRPSRPHDPAAFPLLALPQAVQDYIGELSVAMKAPVDFAGVCCITAASIAIGATVGLHLINPWDELCNLYVAIVAEPGSKKSPIQKQVMRPLRRIAKRLGQQAEKQQEDYDVAMEAWEDTRRKAGRNSRPTEVPAKPEKPHRQRVLTNRATTEVLARILHKNPRGIGLVHDELASLMQAMDQYKEGGKGDDRQFFLSAWSNASDTWDRVSLNGVPLELDLPFLTICGGMPPDKLDSLMGEKRAEDGFVDRFLFCYPTEVREPYWAWEELKPQAQDGWTAIIERLWGLQMQAGEEGATPLFLPMSEPAKEVWNNWYNAHIDETYSELLPPMLKYPWQKKKQYALRLSIIIHWLRWACQEEVKDEYDDWDVAAGCELTNYFKSHGRRVHLRLKQGPVDTRAEKAYQWILAKGGKARLRDLMRAHIANVKTREDGLQLFRQMENRGMGKMHNENLTNGVTATFFEAFSPGNE